MAFGVSIAGWLKPTPDEIEAELTVAFRAEFGSDVTLTPQTFLGQQLQIYKAREIQFWDALETVYYSLFTSTSTGVSLDNTAFPFEREDLKKASVILTFTGDDMTTIAQGSLAQSSDGVQFETVEVATIGGSTVDVLAQALVAGESGNFPVGAITTLPTTITGIDSVTNNSAAIGGKGIETDAEFKARIEVESQTSKSSSVAAIRKAVMAVEGITQVNVEENETDIDDPISGLPSHSIQIIVTGAATNEAIATAIYNSKPAGIGTFGAESFDVVDGTETYAINFDFSSTVDIYVDVFVTTDSFWIPSNVNIIKHRILKYIGGVDENDNAFAGLPAGTDVLSWKIVASLFDLYMPDELGITEVTVELSRTTDPSSGETSNLVMAAYEKAITDLSFITVTEV